MMYALSQFHSQTPAASPDAITVGGTRRGDKLYKTGDKTGTNYGKCVDVFAPGQDIRSAGCTSRTAVVTFSGTSMATPLVSGAAAIYWNRNKEAGPQELKRTIINYGTANRISFNEIKSSKQKRETPNCLLFID